MNGNDSFGRLLVSSGVVGIICAHDWSGGHASDVGACLLLKVGCSCKRKERSRVSAKQNLPNLDHYFSSPYPSIINIANKLFLNIVLLLGLSVRSQPITGQSHFGGVRGSQLEMAVLSKHVCEFIDRARDQQATLPQSVETVLSTKFPAYDTPVTGAGEPCARNEDTEEAPYFQAQEASKKDSDIIVVQVRISPPESAQVKQT